MFDPKIFIAGNNTNYAILTDEDHWIETFGPLLRRSSFLLLKSLITPFLLSNNPLPTNIAMCLYSISIVTGIVRISLTPDEYDAVAGISPDPRLFLHSQQTATAEGKADRV